MKKLVPLFSSLPSIAWVIIIPIMIALFLGLIIGTFWALASVEGFASVLVLGVAVLIAYWSRGGASEPQASSFMLAIGISFFALMGATIDQPGNPIYNLPIEVIYCKDGSFLNRGVLVSHPLPERTDIVQNFQCVTEDGAVTYDISPFQVLLVRFVEYIVIGYGLVAVGRLVRLMKRSDS